MKQTLLAFILCVLVVGTTYSQSKQDSIRELFRVMKNDSVTKKVFESLIIPMMEKKQGMDSAKIAESKKKMEKELQMYKLLKSKLRDEMVLQYDKHFTQEEINELIIFYKSPVGQKYTTVRPEITKEMILLVIQKYLPEMDKKKDKKSHN